jgi:hypothetical protein
MKDLITEIYEELHKIHYHQSGEIEPVVNFNEAIKVAQMILDRHNPNSSERDTKSITSERDTKSIIVKELTKRD